MASQLLNSAGLAKSFPMHAIFDTTSELPPKHREMNVRPFQQENTTYFAVENGYTQSFGSFGIGPHQFKSDLPNPRFIKIRTKFVQYLSFPLQLFYILNMVECSKLVASTSLSLR